MTVKSAHASVDFRVVFTPEEVCALERGADAHYDAVCRNFQPLKILTQYVENKIEPSVILTWHDLDILSKICESPLVPDDVSQTVWAMFADLRKRTETAQTAIEAHD